MEPISRRSFVKSLGLGGVISLSASTREASCAPDETSAVMPRNDPVELRFRQVHLDFHTSPLIPGVGEDFEAEEFVATLKSAHINSINIFAKDHHGMSYYPTKVGTMHPISASTCSGE